MQFRKLLSIVICICLSSPAMPISAVGERPQSTGAVAGNQVIVFGPETYTRASGAPSKVTKTFSARYPNVKHTLVIQNGTTAADLVTSAIVEVNGVRVFGPNDFSNNRSTLEKLIPVQAENTISVEVRGAPGSTMTVRLFGPGASFTVYSRPGDPQLLKVVSPNGDEVNYFGLRDARGYPTRLTEVWIKTAEGQTEIKFGENRKIKEARVPNGVRFSFDWLSETEFGLTLTAPDNSIEIITKVSTLPQPTASILSSEPVNSFRPNLPIIRRKRPSQNSILSLQQKLVAAGAEKNVTLQNASSLTLPVSIQVIRCGFPFDDAENARIIISGVNTAGEPYSRPFPAISRGNGFYVAQVPLEDGPGIPPDPEYCKQLADVINDLCEYNTYAFLTCEGIAAALAATGIGAPKAAALAAACVILFKATDLACDLNGVPGMDKDLSERLCDAVVDNTTVAGNFTAKGIVWIPGIEEFKAGSVVASNYVVPTIRIDTGETAYVKFTITPASPFEGQEYVARAINKCMKPGTRADLTIVGTDGYTDIISVTYSQGTTAEGNVLPLIVPGAERGVEDEVTITITPPDGPAFSQTKFVVFR
jgi:hypothetical protein